MTSKLHLFSSLFSSVPRGRAVLLCLVLGALGLSVSAEAHEREHEFTLSTFDFEGSTYVSPLSINPEGAVTGWYRT